MSPARGLVLRLTFVAAALLLPLQVVILARFGEPYPALVQPAFNGPGPLVGDVLTLGEFRALVTTATGRVHELQAQELLPYAGELNTQAVLARHLLNSTSANSDSTREWLIQRFAALFPGEVVTEVRFGWVSGTLTTSSLREQWSSMTSSVEVLWTTP